MKKGKGSKMGLKKIYVHQVDNGFNLFVSEEKFEDRSFVAKTSDELAELVKKIMDDTIDEEGETTE